MTVQSRPGGSLWAAKQHFRQWVARPSGAGAVLALLCSAALVIGCSPGAPPLPAGPTPVRAEPAAVAATLASAAPTASVGPGAATPSGEARSTPPPATPTISSPATPEPTLTARGGRPADAPSPPPTATAPAGASLRYVVRNGDTVSQVAERLGASVEAIVAANPDLEGDPDTLEVGQELTVPASPDAAASRPAAADTRSAERSGKPPPGAAESGGQQPSPTPTQRPAVNSRSGQEKAPQLPPNLEPYQAQFLERAISPARQSHEETGIPASVTLAQAILESDWGRSRLATEAQNYFGIKASRKPGPAGVVWMRTYEAGIGYVDAPFRAYHNMAESFVDHGKFFSEVSLYAKALAVRDNAREFAQAIHRAGYATDPAYADKLLRVMDRLKL